MCERENKYLKPHLDYLEIIDNNKRYPEYLTLKLKQWGIPLNLNSKTNNFIDWKLVNPKYSIFYNYIGSEDEIEKLLLSSDITREENIIIELGPMENIYKMKTIFFIKNWDDFLKASSYMGMVIVSENGKKFMEFTDQEFLLYSNFYVR